MNPMRTPITGDWTPTRTPPKPLAGPLTACRIHAKGRIELVLETLHAIEQLTH